jgi:cation diffusion facilitator family transporter
LAKPESPETGHYRSKERSVFIGFLLGLFTIFPKIVAVLIANSITLLSDLLQTCSETLGSFFSWLTLRRVAKGKTFLYNYGYGKLENLSSMVIAGVMIISFAVIIYNAIERFRNPVTVHKVGLGLLIAIAAAGVNVVLWRRLYLIALAEHSPVMESQWRLYRAKTMTNLCVLVSLGLAVALRRYAWSVYIDPVGSVLLSFFLLYSAYRVVGMSMYDLLDRSLEESLQLIILKELTSYYDEYRQLHGIRSRRSGATVYVEIFLEFDQNRKMAEVHRVIDEMKTSLEREIKGSQVAIVPATSPMV